MEFLRKRLGLLIRILISGSILGYLGFKIHWAEIAERVRFADPGWLILAVALIGGTMLIAAYRWLILLRVHDIRPGFGQVLQVTMIGQFFNAFLLGTTGGDVVKIIYMTQLTPGKKSAAGLTVIFDRVIGLVALVFLTLVLTSVHYHFLIQTPDSRKALWTFYLIAAGAVGVILLAWALPTLMHFANLKSWEKKMPFHEKIEHLSDAFRRNARSGGTNVEALLISFLGHGLGLFGQFCVAKALHLDVSLWMIMTVTGVINVLISIPISVAGLGVRESLFILFLGLSGIPSEGAVAVSLIGFALSLVWSFVGGIIHLRYKKPFDEALMQEPLL